MTQRKNASKGKRKQPLVSIIIPVYNAEKTIGRCLDSLINQTIADQIEIIAVDDGSTDSSLEVLKKYHADYPQLVKVFHQANSGPSTARNLGLAQATGEFIGFVDSDDYVAADMYEKMSRQMSKEIDLVIAGRYNVDAKGRKTEVLHRTCPSNTSISETPQLISKISTFVWDKLFRSSIISNNYLQFSENLKYAEDLEFLLRYLYFSKNAHVISEPLYYYYTNNVQSATGTCNSNWLHIPIVINNINNFFLQHCVFAYYKSELFRIAEGLYCRRINRFPYSNNKHIQWQFVKDFHHLFDYYFDGWQSKVANYRTRRAKRYRTSLPKMFIYIYIPNFIQRSYTQTCAITNKFIKQLSKLKQGRYRYAKYRKRYDVNSNQVLFMSYFGGNVTDSPYYMAKELAAHSNMKIYVASRQLGDDRIYLDRNELSNVKLVKVHSPEFIRLLATAKYVINNSRLPDYVVKRPEQVFLNTWHGTPLKTLGRDMHTGLKDLGNNQTQFLMSDYLLYPNEYTRDHIMDAFGLANLYGGKVILAGYPRNDILCNNPQRDELRHNLGLGNDTRAYAYMPTWRGETISTSDVAKYQAEIESILSTLDALLDDSIVIFVKLHQVVMKKIKLSKYRHIRPFDAYLETYNFLSLMDGLITDYSSVFYDYANTGREIILFTYDYDQYLSSRGVYTDIKSLPFPLIYATTDLANYLNKSHQFEPDDKYSKFVKEYCQHDSPNNSALINKILFDNQQSSAITDYSQNGQVQHHIIFCTNLATPDRIEQFKEIITNLKPNDILVFKQKTFKPVTNDIIRQYDKQINNYIVVPASTPLTVADKIRTVIFRKTGLLRHSVHALYQRELDRILPGINISKITNYTHDKRFQDMVKLFSDNRHNDRVSSMHKSTKEDDD